jgi:hypothetical protein
MIDNTALYHTQQMKFYITSREPTYCSRTPELIRFLHGEHTDL